MEHTHTRCALSLSLSVSLSFAFSVRPARLITCTFVSRKIQSHCRLRRVNSLINNLLLETTSLKQCWLLIHCIVYLALYEERAQSFP